MTLRVFERLLYEITVENGVLRTITSAKARELAKPTLAKVNQPDRTPETAVSLVDFVEHIYLPRMEQQKRPSTVKGYRDIWANHLRGRSLGLWMREIRTCDIQRILDEIARPGILSGNSLRHIKSQVSGIFSYAKQQGYFDGENPARNTAIPPARLSEETYAYSLEEIGQILSVLSEPAATIFAVAAFTGARRGEIRGLMWENYQDGEIQITRSIWKGHVTEPKTRKSRGAIPVIAPLAKRLEFHRASSGNRTSGVMFPQPERFTHGLGEPSEPCHLTRAQPLRCMRKAERGMPETRQRDGRRTRSQI